MFVLRALNSFAVRLGDRKPDKSHCNQSLRGLQNDSWMASCLQRGMQRSATPERTNIITIIINRRCYMGLLSHSQHLNTSFIDIILEVLKVDLRLLLRLPFFNLTWFVLAHQWSN